MARTYWISTLGNNTTGDGLTPATAWQTLAKISTFLAASGQKGDVFNVINDGTYTMPTGAVTQIYTSLVGTSYDADPGFVVQGTTSSGAPALVDVIGYSTGSRMFYLRNNGSASGARYVVVRGFNFDWTNYEDKSHTIFYLYEEGGGGTVGPCRVEYSSFQHYADNSAVMGVYVGGVFLGDSDHYPSNIGEVRYCYIRNTPGICWAYTYAGLDKKASIHDCVIHFVGNWAGAYYGRIGFGSLYDEDNTIEYYHNSVILTAGTSQISGLVQYTATGGELDTVNWHSNLAWLDSTEVAGFTVFLGAGAIQASAGTIGYNVVYWGPNVIETDVTDIYTGRWQYNGTPKSTDVIQYTKAQTTIFNAPTTAWDWENINDSGYTIPLDGDFRPIAHLDSGMGGSVPGALPGVGEETSGGEGEVTHNNLVLEFDFFTETWTKHVYMADSTEVFGFNSFLEMKRGDEVSKILAACDAIGATQVGTGAVQVIGDVYYENDVNVGVPWEFKTKYFDCGEPDIIKTFLTLLVRLRTPTNISVDFDVDEGSVTGSLEDVEPANHTWDEADLNWQGAVVETEDHYWGTLKQGDTLLRFPQDVCGRRVSFTFSGVASIEGTEVQGLTITYYPESRDVV